MRRVVFAGAVIAVIAALSVVAALPGAFAQGPGGPGGMRPGGAMPFPPDSFAADRDSLVKITMERIQGREKAPAESVFKNIKVMRGRTAEQLLRGMNGIGRSLGVPCSHCHVENHWADEDKATKEEARNMIRMTGALNDSLIPEYQWPHNDKPHVGCFTCHHGQAKPGGGGERRPGGQGGPGGQGRPEGQPRPDGDRR